MVKQFRWANGLVFSPVTIFVRIPDQCSNVTNKMIRPFECLMLKNLDYVCFWYSRSFLYFYSGMFPNISLASGAGWKVFIFLLVDIHGCTFPAVGIDRRHWQWTVDDVDGCTFLRQVNGNGRNFSTIDNYFFLFSKCQYQLFQKVQLSTSTDALLDR